MLSSRGRGSRLKGRQSSSLPRRRRSPRQLNELASGDRGQLPMEDRPVSPSPSSMDGALLLGSQDTCARARPRTDLAFDLVTRFLQRSCRSRTAISVVGSACVVIVTISGAGALRDVLTDGAAVGAHRSSRTRPCGGAGCRRALSGRGRRTRSGRCRRCLDARMSLRARLPRLAFRRFQAGMRDGALLP